MLFSIARDRRGDYHLPHMADETHAAAEQSNAEAGGVMSFGDHLEELRRCSILALIGLAVATILSLVFARRILAFIVQPALVVLRRHGQPTELQALSPPETFLMYLKTGLLCGLIISMPWILWQAWRFVSVGLYRHERRFMKFLAPASVGLFAIGVTFMFFVVLPIVINFFVGFSKKVTVTDLQPSRLQTWLIGGAAKEGQDQPPPLDVKIPSRSIDPEDPPLGSMWFNTERGTQCVMTEHGVMETRMTPAGETTAIRNQFGLSFYVSFVLSLSLAFGLAFELPLVVLFLVGTHVVTIEDLTRVRRHVILGMFVVSALITPPDVLSQVLLAIPMVILFEGALIAARGLKRRWQ